MDDQWTVKNRGNAKIHIHPDLERAVVHNPWGITWNGQTFASVEEAKAAAMEAKNA